MQNEKITIAVCFRHDKYQTCIQYIFDLFARTYGYECTYVCNGNLTRNVDAIIHYITPDQAEHITLGTPTVIIDRGPFFGENSVESFGQTTESPAQFNDILNTINGTAFEKLAQPTSTQTHIRPDIITAAFILLSGYYEWIAKQHDPYGRVLASRLPLPRHTWDTPVVNHLFRQLDELIRSMLSGSAPVAKPKSNSLQTICLTHDIDLMRKYRPGKLPGHLIRSAKQGPARLTSELNVARQVLIGSTPDPYDSFDKLYTVKDRVSAPSTFFFLGSKPGGKNGDYNINDRKMRDLLSRARMYGDEIAMHGSWNSRQQTSVLKAEKQAIENAARTQVAGSRQHYLRFSTPETWRCLSEAGIRYDSTGGFPDQCGFKYGWSGCFQPFDLHTLQPLPILEIPLVCMDVTLSAYEKIPAELALERLTNLLDSSCDNVPGGAFVFLWHNVMGDKKAYPGYWDTFEYFFSVASGSARFLTLSQLCDEYEAGH